MHNRFRSLRRALGTLRAAAAAFALIVLASCTPKSVLVGSLLPDGAIPVMLSNLERVEDTNRRRVVELESRRDWSGLARFAEENLAGDPWNADWWTVAGYAYSQLGRHPRAAEAYAEVVRLAPDEPLGWNLLAAAYRAGGRSDAAVRTLNNALLVGRNSPVTFFLLGESLSDLRRDEEALGAYRRAVELDRELAPAWLGLGRAYARLGRRADLARVRDALERLDPSLARELPAPQTAPASR